MNKDLGRAKIWILLGAVGVAAALLVANNNKPPVELPEQAQAPAVEEQVGPPPHPETGAPGETGRPEDVGKPEEAGRARGHIPQEVIEPQAPIQVQVPAPQLPPQAKAPTVPASAVAAGLEVRNAIAKGASGEDVKTVQEFLANFPGLYPEKLVTGYYGNATEEAIKRFQEKINLPVRGEIDGKTKEVMNRMMIEIARKRPPKLLEVTPDSGDQGVKVTLFGRGFADEDNAIFVRGKTIVTGLVSDQGGTEISFILPSDTPCVVGQACPLKVLNKNGISNARPFKLAAALVPIEPLPPPPPPPTEDTQALCSDGLDNDNDGFIDLKDSDCAAFVPAPLPPPPPPPPSPPPPPTEDTQALCSDGLDNDNDGFIDLKDPGCAAFIPPPPVVTSFTPSFGPVGANVTIAGSGFTSTGNSVNFAGVNNAVTGLSSSDGKSLTFAVPQSSCGAGKSCSVSVTNVNGTSNAASFLMTQVITPVKVTAPNGGETLVQGLTNTISWTGGTDRVHLLLMSGEAASGVDPRDFIVGWISTSSLPDGSYKWDFRKVCNLEATLCSQVNPGDYKILALSEDEFGFLNLWDDVFSKAGNWDVGDGVFKLLPEASIKLYIPNGGEYMTMGSTMTICWETYNLPSKTVTITLMKGGVAYRTVNANYVQDAETGAYVLGWTIPNDLAAGSDYTIKINDATVTQISDTSDRPFTIVARPTYIRVYRPTGTDVWVKTYQDFVNHGNVYWYGSNLPSQAVNINLLKGGVFYRNLASNVPQKYWWSGQIYSTGGFSTDTPVFADIPDGNDYTVEVTDASDPSIKGVSPAPFKIVSMPDYITTRVRLLDHFTKTPFANQTSSLYDGATYRIVRTDANGEFSFTATTSQLLSKGYAYFSVSPNCYESKSVNLYRDRYGLYTYASMFPFAGPYRYYRVYSGDNNLGDLPFWQMSRFDIAADTPVKASAYFRDPQTGRAEYELWPYRFQTVNQWLRLPVALDIWGRIEDFAENVGYSPYLNLPAGTCPVPRVLSYFDGKVEGQPYRLELRPPYVYTTVGRGVRQTAYATAGSPPYVWQNTYGALPPELNLGSSGLLSGTTTAPGLYEATVKATDAKGVSNAGRLYGQVRNSDGTIPPYIRVTYPYTRLQYYQGGSLYIDFNSYKMANKTVSIELRKAGQFYRSISSNYVISTSTVSVDRQTYIYGDTAYSWYRWLIPYDVPIGTDYSVRIFDAANSAVYGESEPFWIISGAGAYWGAWGNSYYQNLNFYYATSNIVNTQAFKLYEKKPGDADFRLAASFNDIHLCTAYSSGWTSGIWRLRLSSGCTGATGMWQISGPYAPSSQYPVGAYEYYVTFVSKSGVESAPLARLRMHNLEKVKILTPTSSTSPTLTSNPMIRWTVPSDWPSGIDKNFTILVRGIAGGVYRYIYIWTLVGPWDETGFRQYAGSELDLTQKYSLDVWAGMSVFDPTLQSRVSYVAMDEATQTFWINP